jgi:chromate transporter
MNDVTASESPQANSAVPSYTLWQLVGYMLGLGTWGFGGPVALVGYMHRDLVDGRRWFTEADYREGMVLSQLMPGPLAAQLAIYLGYVHYHVLGATLVGLAFVIPSFLMVVAIGAAYVEFGGISWMQAVFYGVGASVIGIIAISAYKLATKSLGKDKLLWAIFAISGTITFVTQNEWVGLFIGAGILVWLLRAPPKNLGNKLRSSAAASAPIVVGALATAGDGSRLMQIAGFFAYAGSFVFGSGLAIVPFLYSGAVVEHGWLNDRQFVDAVAVAMITPGPVVITTGFIGYLVEGFPGACVAALATFVPCYLLTILPAPYFKKHGKHPGIVAFVDGVTAAAVGALAGAVLVIAQRSITDWLTAALAIVTAGILWRWKLPEPVVVIAAALIGLVAYPLMKQA